MELADKLKVFRNGSTTQNRLLKYRLKQKLSIELNINTNQRLRILWWLKSLDKSKIITEITHGSRHRNC
jgi:hypothetical protein